MGVIAYTLMTYGLTALIAYALIAIIVGLDRAMRAKANGEVK